jgi:hypothetical protein
MSHLRAAASSPPCCGEGVSSTMVWEEGRKAGGGGGGGGPRIGPPPLFRSGHPALRVVVLLVIQRLSLVRAWPHTGDFSLNVPRMFPECSPNVPRMFPECSPNVPRMFSLLSSGPLLCAPGHTQVIFH